MRDTKTNLPCKAFKIVASRMVAKYTASFQAHDEDNIVLGNGYEALYIKLLDRNNYLNRPNKRKYAIESSTKNIKKVANARVGCPNWQPSVNSPKDAEEKKIFLNTMSDTDPQFIALMKETFPIQREFINNNFKTIYEVYEEWPSLFTEKGILTHFEILTNINLSEIDIVQKSKKLQLFGVQKKMKLLDSDNLLMTAIKISAHYFKEDISCVIYQIKVCFLCSTYL